MKTLSSFIISIVGSVILFLIFRFLKAKSLEQNNRAMKAYVESMQAFSNEIEKKIVATRKYRHDLKGYVQTIKSLLGTESQNEDVKNYIKQQKEAIKSVTAYSSDEFINTVINLKQDECRQKGIATDFVVEDGDYSAVESIDKVCLIVNLLDNAIEATEKIKSDNAEPIKMKIFTDCTGIKILLKNSLAENTKFSFKTSKQDKFNHGFGTEIIKQVIEKYHGTRNTVAENKILTDEIFIPVPAKEVNS